MIIEDPTRDPKRVGTLPCEVVISENGTGRNRYLAASNRPDPALLSGRLIAALFPRFCSQVDWGWDVRRLEIWCLAFKNVDHLACPGRWSTVMQKDELARDRMYGRHWQHLNALYRRSDEIKPNLLELFQNKRRIRRCAEKTRRFVAGFFNVISHQRPAAWSHSSLAVAKINVIVDNPQKRLMMVLIRNQLETSTVSSLIICLRRNRSQPKFRVDEYNPMSRPGSCQAT